LLIMQNQISEKIETAGSIPATEALEAVHKRHRMYFGSISPRSLQHVFYKIVDNSVDEALAGHCNNLVGILGKM
jgi:DNA gyrase subunit B